MKMRNYTIFLFLNDGANITFSISCEEGMIEKQNEMNVFFEDKSPFIKIFETFPGEIRKNLRIDLATKMLLLKKEGYKNK